MGRPEEEKAQQLELVDTKIDRGLARAVTIAFLLLIFGLPVLQVIVELKRGERIQALDVFRRSPTRQNLQNFEEEIDHHSAAKQFVQPQVQALFTGALKFGNDKVVLGEKGWLFYQYGIDYLTGPGITDRAHLTLRTKKMSDRGESDPHADPLPAILQFAKDCKEANVHLVVFPAPDKAMLQPAQLSKRLAFTGEIAPYNNSDYAEFLKKLRAAGVDVFDALPEKINATDVRFLEQDTHWNPEFMEKTARELAAHIQSKVPLPPFGAMPKWKLQPHDVSRMGDLVDMLRLPADQKLYSPQRIEVHSVQYEDGSAWEPSPNAQILLLGDSYTNIFSAGEMGWGAGAGLAEHLSYNLKRSIDVIARNGSGATATRAEFAKRPEPFKGLLVIVWEFAVRDLAKENWQPIPIRNSPQRHEDTKTSEEIIIEGELLTGMPKFDLNASPYVNALVTNKYKVRKIISGSYSQAEALVSTIMVKDRKVQDVARFQKGQAVRMKLLPQAPKQVSTWQRVDETGEIDLQELWAAEIAPQQ